MGQPVVHFEVIGKDGEKLRGYYSELFGWEMDANNPMNYGMVQREGNVNADGVGLVAVSDHRAAAVLAPRRQGVDRAFEAVEHVARARDRDLNRLVVLVAADLTGRHRRTSYSACGSATRGGEASSAGALRGEQAAPLVWFTH